MKSLVVHFNGLYVLANLDALLKLNQSVIRGLTWWNSGTSESLFHVLEGLDILGKLCFSCGLMTLSETSRVILSHKILFSTGRKIDDDLVACIVLELRYVIEFFLGWLVLIGVTTA